MVFSGALPAIEHPGTRSDSHLLRVASSSSGQHAASDRRDAYRLELRRGRARIELPDAGHLQLRDLSATGSSLLLDGPTDLGRGGVLEATFHLPDEPAFRADLHIIRQLRDGAGELAVGTKFSSLDRSAMRSLSRFMVREHMQRGVELERLVENRRALRTRDGAYIARLLRADAVHEQRPLQVFAPGRPLPVRVQISSLAIDGHRDVMLGVLGGDAAELVKGAELMFMLPGRSSVALFNARILDRRDQRVMLSLPTEVFQTGFRDSHRTPISDPSVLRISFRHPHLLGQRIERGVLDVAARGLAFPVNTEHDLLFPGDRLPDVQVTLPDGEVLETVGVIRGMREKNGTKIECGVELRPFENARDRRRWHQFVFQTAHPRLHRASEHQLNAVWEVFEKSQYINKWVDADVSAQLHREFRQSWQNAASRSGEILVLNQRERALGTIAANQIYPRTWLMHSLAVDKSARASGQRPEFLGMVRELYSGIMYTLQHEAGTRYFLAYFEETKSWNQRLYRDFARDYVDENDQRYDPLFVYKVTSAAPAPVPSTPSSVRVVRAGGEHRQLIAARATADLSPMLVDGLALDESVLDLQSFSRACTTAGLVRSREILVAMEDGHPVLAAICEGGGAGINVFGLMNLCWTMPLSSQPPSPAASRALFEAVRVHYAGLGVAESVLIESTDERRSLLAGIGYRFVSPGIRWLARVQVLPAWLSYVENELGVERPSSSESVG